MLLKMFQFHSLFSESCEVDLVLEPETELFAPKWFNFGITYSVTKIKNDGSTSFWKASEPTYIEVCRRFISQRLAYYAYKHLHV